MGCTLTYYTKFLILLKYKLLESNDINVTTSTELVAAVGTYALPLTCFTLEGNDIEPVPGDGWVILKLIVWPGWIFVGLTYVLDPETNVNVKKLPVDKSSDAVLELIDKASTSPLTEPVNIELPTVVNEPLTVNFLLQ